MRSTVLWFLARALLATHFVFAVVAWFNLPARVPTHFGLTGAADAWSDGPNLSWFFVLAVSLGLQVMMQLLTLPGARELWNMPEKERFLRLTPEQQRPVVELMRTFGGFSALCVSTTMFALHIGVYLTAHGYTHGLPWYIFVAMFVPTLCLLGALIPWSKAVRRTILQVAS